MVSSPSEIPATQLEEIVKNSIVADGQLTYDANGNTKSDERNNSYSFDAWNRLAQVVTSSSTLTYRYDALNRRIVESVLQGMLATGRDLYYSKDWQVLEERSLGTVQARNVWSAVYVDGMVLRDSNGQRLYVQQDANWNVTAIINSAGAPQERYVYDPYGKAMVLDPVAWTVRGSGTYGTSNFGWVYLHQGGRYTRFDDLSGLYYFRFRDLSPTLGRWMEEDLVMYQDGMDLYLYEADSAVNRLDSTGLESPKPWGPGDVVIHSCNSPKYPTDPVKACADKGGRTCTTYDRNPATEGQAVVRNCADDLDELCSMIKSERMPHQRYDRLIIAGHCGGPAPADVSFGPRKPRFGPPLPAKCLAAIGDVVSPDGMVLICFCGYMNNSKVGWEQSLQDLADELGREVCACSGPATMSALGCECIGAGSTLVCKKPSGNGSRMGR
jgi:RHS repeat-associated protein